MIPFYWLYLRRVLFSYKTIFQFSSFFSFFGLVLAVASLTVALLAVSGFSAGLEQTLVNVQGHLRVQSENPVSREDLIKDLLPYKNLFADQVLFLSFEGLILRDSQSKGVFFESVEDERLGNFSFLRHRILEGTLNPSRPFIIVGSGLARDLGLSAGSEALIVTSQKGDFYFSRSQFRFYVSAVVDFGRQSFNSRLVLMPLSSARLLGRDKLSGVNLWLKRKNQTESLKRVLQKNLSKSYFITSWKDIDKYFFKIIESDKKIIFSVLLILVIAAGFNISSALFVQVFQKTKDINILRAMGGQKSLIRNLFLLNGLVLGLFGSVIGVGTGLLFFRLLIFIQNKWHFLSTELYRINDIVWDWKSMDIFIVFIASLGIVILSSFMPANQACRMDVKRGLSYDR